MEEKEEEESEEERRKGNSRICGLVDLADREGVRSVMGGVNRRSIGRFNR